MAWPDAGRCSGGARRGLAGCPRCCGAGPGPLGRASWSRAGRGAAPPSAFAARGARGPTSDGACDLRRLWHADLSPPRRWLCSSALRGGLPALAAVSGPCRTRAGHRAAPCHSRPFGAPFHGLCHRPSHDCATLRLSASLGCNYAACGPAWPIRGRAVSGCKLPDLRASGMSSAARTVNPDDRAGLICDTRFDICT